MGWLRNPMTRYQTGILLLYHRPVFGKDASTVREHIDSFSRFSQFPIISLNTALGFPGWLRKSNFQGILLHYSLFGSGHYPMEGAFVDYLDQQRSSYTIAFFQDEYYFCPKRFAFIQDHDINCIFTLLEERYHDIYSSRTGVESIHTTLTGYVGESLAAMGRRYARPDRKREIDIGYRGRELLPYMGRAAREKTWIAEEFQRQIEMRGSNLAIDIETKEFKRLYGKDWYRFLGNCRGSLGVEAGVSVFDLDGEVYDAYVNLAEAYPSDDFDAMAQRLAPVMDPWEDQIFYRTISPRHFESAALGICQILFEGKYSGILTPGEHYIPLEKDFSNLDDVLAKFRSPAFRDHMRATAYRDLIASGEYSYRRFIEMFDRVLIEAGLRTGRAHGASRLSLQAAAYGAREKLLLYRSRRLGAVSARMRGITFGTLARLYRWTQTSPFARRYVVPVIRPFMRPLVRLYKKRQKRRFS